MSKRFELNLKRIRKLLLHLSKKEKAVRKMLFMEVDRRNA